jgi:hypothetical protein
MPSAEFPSEIITNTDTKAVSLTPQIEATLPGINSAFAEANEGFLDNPERYLTGLESSMFQFRFCMDPQASRMSYWWYLRHSLIEIQKVVPIDYIVI